jgi:HSP20 family protein
MMLATRNFAVPPFSELRRELDRMFDNFVGTSALPRTQTFPALNAWEDGERVLVEAEVPGLTLENLDITIHGNELKIQGQRPHLADEKVTYHRRERGTGEFTRFLTLPVDVDAERVEAALKNGVLTIVLPKSEKARARKIEVKTA